MNLPLLVPTESDCDHVQTCGFCAARDNRLVKAEARIAGGVFYPVKLQVYRLAMYVQLNLPWLWPLLDRILHPFGIEIGG